MATASIILNEQVLAVDVIKRQLAYGERNKVRAAYNHAQYLLDRKKILHRWADCFDQVREFLSNRQLDGESESRVALST